MAIKTRSAETAASCLRLTFRGPVTISGNVYNDVNGTGTYSVGDTGLGGITLTLTGTTATGQSITATTTTAADGSYTFIPTATANC